MLAADTSGFAVELLTPKEFALGGTIVTTDTASGTVVIVVDVAAGVGVVAVVVVVGRNSGFVVDVGAIGLVNAVVCPEGGVVDVVRVNTSTSRRTGLDHMRMRVPLIELWVDAIRVEG
ncbi:MAG TPA: hypothetical protein VMV96_05135 [Acidimicrobiales bacterium]|nr:hypothetical protein [Acidimicrobiales bacterium]